MLVKIKSSGSREIILSFTDISNLNVENMSFNAIREKKFSRKIPNLQKYQNLIRLLISSYLSYAA